jgi:hypothetical protein
VSENEKVELLLYPPKKQEDLMGIQVLQVLHAILCGVSILIMFDQRFHFEILPNFHLCQIWGGAGN